MKRLLFRNLGITLFIGVPLAGLFAMVFGFLFTMAIQPEEGVDFLVFIPVAILTIGTFFLVGHFIRYIDFFELFGDFLPRMTKISAFSKKTDNR